MFFDPFSFTPPQPVNLTRAVESYQRVAATRFCHYARDAMNPDLLPLKVRGDLLEPTPKQLHAEVRALRHLTAIQRTLRDIGGPLFDPDSPLSPEKRFQLVERRLNEIEDALGLDDDTFADSTPGTPSACSASSSSDFSGSSDFSSPDLSSRSSRPLCLENSSSLSSDFYHPPEIEDLLSAVNFAQHVFAARAELLDKRRLKLSHEDFLLEIASLRDLTSIIRTLRRMSARPLPEHQSAEDVQRELATAATECAASSNPSSSEIQNPQSEIHNPAPAHPSHPSYQSHDFNSTAPSPVTHNASESVKSVKSLDGFHSSSPRVPPRTPRSNEASPETSSSGLIHPLGGDRPLRPVPRVPEVRVIAPRHAAAPPSEPATLPGHSGEAGSESPPAGQPSQFASASCFSDSRSDFPDPESPGPNSQPAATPPVPDEPHPPPIPDDP